MAVNKFVGALLRASKLQDLFIACYPGIVLQTPLFFFYLDHLIYNESME
jgi:hypothetical protein